jgi:hypothetical protein
MSVDRRCIGCRRPRFFHAPHLKHRRRTLAERNPVGRRQGQLVLLLLLLLLLQRRPMRQGLHLQGPCRRQCSQRRQRMRERMCDLLGR